MGAADRLLTCNARMSDFENSAAPHHCATCEQNFTTELLLHYIMYIHRHTCTSPLLQNPRIVELQVWKCIFGIFKSELTPALEAKQNINSLHSNSLVRLCVSLKDYTDNSTSQQYNNAISDIYMSNWLTNYLTVKCIYQYSVKISLKLHFC